MKKIIPLIFVLHLFILISCNRSDTSVNQNNTDKDLSITEKFNKTKNLAKCRSAELFDIFKQKLSPEEQTLLEFLYAYMPLSDLADYNGKFFLKNVQSSLAARNGFSWGKSIPEHIFNH
ncbi:MAG: hypothetical protein C0594_15870, partial [Marinilabiliales bacterium]